jgi:hypothetical protein
MRKTRDLHLRKKLQPAEDKSGWSPRSDSCRPVRQQLVGITADRRHLQNLAYCAENISLDNGKMTATLGAFSD